MSTSDPINAKPTNRIPAFGVAKTISQLTNNVYHFNADFTVTVSGYILGYNNKSKGSTGVYPIDILDVLKNVPGVTLKQTNTFTMEIVFAF